MAVTINELEMTDFPPLKLTETSRVLKENEETIKNKLKIRVWWIIQNQPESLLKKSKVLISYPSFFSFLVPVLTGIARTQFLK